MIFVCDDFLKDPFSVRKEALKSTYSSQGNTPGYRCQIVDKFVSNYILSTIKEITKNDNLKIQSGYQYSTKDFKEGLFHRDSGRYTCIIFLTPKPDKNSGTEICESNIKYEIPDKWADDKHRFYQNTYNFTNRLKYDILRRKINTKFKPNYIVENKYNRMVVFNSNNYHRAQKFFGTEIKNSRLTLLSFIS